MLPDNLAFSSSVKDDVWHSKKDPRSYEWWYFDALSDDGREAVIIIFLDNFIYSPRYNRSNRRIDDHERFPAVSFTYFVDGKVVYRAVQEYRADEFSASEKLPECSIGGSSFRMEAATYGTGYLVKIAAELSGGRKLDAQLEWLSVESDFSSESFCYEESRHCWNLVAPRSDVTGHIAVSDRSGRLRDTRNFRGTGYHDHNLDNRWLAKTVQDWHWGRAHFANATAVFFRIREAGSEDASTKLILIQGQQMHETEVTIDVQDYDRDGYGIKYPSRLILRSSDDVHLRVETASLIDSSFYFVRFLSEMTLETPGMEPRTTKGITEFISPKSLKYRWLNRISDIRTGKNGKPSRF